MHSDRCGRPATAAPSDGDPAALAEAFLHACVEHLGWSREEYTDRRSVVLRDLETTGTYTHTTEELQLGAKLAWRNHTRCIGKLYWRSLRIWDRRHVHAVDDMVRVLEEHQRWAFNGGRIRPLITVFKPDAPDAPGPRIINQQLVQYAGYRSPDGTRAGDGATIDLTQNLLDLGWPGRYGHFDRLPVLIRQGDGSQSWHRLGADSCPDVPITHPELPWLAELGLYWYAFPTVSDMRLSIGGIAYGAAPFSGWYVCTEIGARDFGDTDRYDLLQPVAERMGLDTRNERTLWKDRAMVELNAAVLTSYAHAGIKLLDHHTMTDQFHRFVQAESRHGRPVHAEWKWIVPPMAASATPVYGEEYAPVVAEPNFFRR